MARTKHVAKNKRENRNRLITIVVFIITFIILSLLITNNYFTITRLINKNKELNAKLSLLKDEQISKKDEQKTLMVSIDELNNLDDTISMTKNEVFNLAKDLENKIINNETKYKIAYITFDDGPYHSTDQVLDILKKYKIKATFFTIGLDKDTCYDSPSYSCYNTYKKIVDAGHTIANHTYSHQIFRGIYSSANSFTHQVKLQEELIKERTGVKTNILRFPGGIGTANALAGNQVNDIKNWLKENNYGWVDWTAQDGDGGYLPSYDVAWDNFTKSIDENIEVILFHDYSNITIAMLPEAIEYLQNKDYILLPLFYDSVKINK